MHRTIFHTLIPSLGAIILILFVKLFILDLAVVKGASMVPQLKPGNVVFIFRAAYGIPNPFSSGYLLKWHSPEKDDLVAAVNPRDGAPVVKRVAAVGPESIYVTMENSIIVVNKNATENQLTASNPRKIDLAQGQFFLLGDNPVQSLDSRDYGPIGLSEIWGRVLGIP